MVLQQDNIYIYIQCGGGGTAAVIVAAAAAYSRVHLAGPLVHVCPLFCLWYLIVKA